MRISEAFCKMRLSEYCTTQDVDRAIAVTVDSFVGGQKVSCKKALARAFAKYVSILFYSVDKDGGGWDSLMLVAGIRLLSPTRKEVRMEGMGLALGRLLLLSWLEPPS